MIAHVAFMLCPCCFPKHFKNLVFSQVFVHVAFMLCPSVSKPFQEPGVFPGFCA